MALKLRLPFPTSCAQLLPPPWCCHAGLDSIVYGGRIATSLLL
jgi:hypothetical protein